jgi:hypothetical protein
MTLRFSLASEGLFGYHSYDYGYLPRSPAMKQMTASAFKAKCLQLMDEVAATGSRF